MQSSVPTHIGGEYMDSLLEFHWVLNSSYRHSCKANILFPRLDHIEKMPCFLPSPPEIMIYGYCINFTSFLLFIAIESASSSTMSTLLWS